MHGPAVHAARPHRAPSGRAPLAAALALLLALVPAACGGGGGTFKASPAAKETSPAQARVDACALVTREEVEAALASPAGEPESRLLSTNRGSACVFPVTAEGGRRHLQVSVESPLPNRIYTRADMLSFATVSGASQPQPVTDVGEAAYLGSGTLHVLVSGRHLAVGDPQPTPSLKPYDTEALKRVAQKAIERLPK